jgi:hypothetical protein
MEIRWRLRDGEGHEIWLLRRGGECFAPYGLAGLYHGTLTPNPLTPHSALFEQKAASYCQRWDWLRIQEPPAEHVA